MVIRRFIELRILEANEYRKFSGEDYWSFLLRVGDQNIMFTGENFEINEKFNIDNEINKLAEVLESMFFKIDKDHIIELIQDLRDVGLYKYINECIDELDLH